MDSHWQDPSRGWTFELVSKVRLEVSLGRKAWKIIEKIPHTRSRASFSIVINVSHSHLESDTACLAKVV